VTANRQPSQETRPQSATIDALPNHTLQAKTFSLLPIALAIAGATIASAEDLDKLRLRELSAIESFRAAAALAESGQSELINHRFYFQYGITLERGGRHDEAGRMLEKAITLTSRDDPEEAANTMNYLGYMWLELDRHLDKAGELILKANELEPDNAAYIDSLGWWHFKKGDYAKAREELQRAVDLLKEPQPDDAEILEHLAQACVRLGDAAKAREWFGKARDLQPTDAKVKARIEEGLKKVSAP